MIIDLHRHTWSFYQRYPQASEIASKNPGKLDPVHAQSDPLPLVPDWKEAALDHINELDESGVKEAKTPPIYQENYFGNFFHNLTRHLKYHKLFLFQLYSDSLSQSVYYYYQFY